MKPTGSDHPSPTPSSWPVCEMLLRGTFGTKTLAERRLVTCANIITAVVYAAAGVTAIYRKPIMVVLLMFLAAAALTYYALEKRRYFHSLDELTRRIEMEGMAWAYAIGVVATVWFSAVGFAISLRWTLNPKIVAWIPILCFGMLMASVKGAYRYFATRRY